MVILLRYFQETSRISADRKNCLKDVIEAMLILSPEILSDEPKYLHFEIHILLNTWSVKILKLFPKKHAR